MILEKFINNEKKHKVKVICEICEKTRIINWLTAINKEEHICRSCSTTKSRTGKKASEQAKKNMSKAQRKKGYRMQGNGYKGILIDDKNHPRYKNTKGGGYIMEHILILEKELGRFLNKNELVHHIDKNKLNNNINNLYIFSENTLSESKKKHQLAHGSAEDLGIYLYNIGIAEFVNGIYTIKEEYKEKVATLAAKLL